MTQKRGTKQALLLSALSLLLCVSMLVGTTFAWFTDSVTSGSNVIQAGTLDIVMEYWDGDSWEDAEGKVLEFRKASTSAGTEVLWEPGCTYELPKFRIRNAGNLTAKVLIRLNGITGDEKLMEAIELNNTITNIPETVLNGSAGSAFKPYNNATIDLIYGTPDGTIIFDWSLMGKGVVSPNTGHTDTSPEFTISGHMKEEAGNEYQGLKIEGISITALATQEVYEYDSFGREYDKFAPWAENITTEQELLDALNKGYKAILDADIALNSAVDINKPVDIDLNGHTLSVNGLKLANGGYVANGTIESIGHTNMVPHFAVSGCHIEMKDVTVDVNHHLNANSNWSEATGMEIANATAVLNNCNIKIHNTTKAKWVFSYGVSVIDAELTMNGGSITAECVAGTAPNGPTNPNAVCSIGASTATLNNVNVNATYYASTVAGHLTLNTTDASVTSANIVDNNGGSHTLNHIN